MDNFESKCDSKLQDFVISDDLAKKLEFERRDDYDWDAIVDDYLHAKHMMEKASLEMENAKNKLITMSNGKNTRGCGVTVQKITRKGNIDYSSVPALIGVDLEQYRKPETESWRITVDE